MSQLFIKTNPEASRLRFNMLASMKHPTSNTHELAQLHIATSGTQIISALKIKTAMPLQTKRASVNKLVTKLNALLNKITNLFKKVTMNFKKVEKSIYTSTSFSIDISDFLPTKAKPAIKTQNTEVDLITFPKSLVNQAFDDLIQLEQSELNSNENLDSTHKYGWQNARTGLSWLETIPSLYKNSEHMLRQNSPNPLFRRKHTATFSS